MSAPAYHLFISSTAPVLPSIPMDHQQHQQHQQRQEQRQEPSQAHSHSFSQSNYRDRLLAWHQRQVHQVADSRPGVSRTSDSSAPKTNTGGIDILTVPHRGGGAAVAGSPTHRHSTNDNQDLGATVAHTHAAAAAAAAAAVAATAHTSPSVLSPLPTANLSSFPAIDSTAPNLFSYFPPHPTADSGHTHFSSAPRESQLQISFSPSATTPAWLHLESGMSASTTPTSGNPPTHSTQHVFGNAANMPSPTTPTTQSASAHVGSAANRVNQACASCRRKKVRCNGVQPTCGNCLARGVECTYLAQKKRGRPPKAQQRQTGAPYFAPVSGQQQQQPPVIPGTVASSSTPTAHFGTTGPKTPPVGTSFSVGQTHQALSMSMPMSLSMAGSVASAPEYFSQWASAANPGQYSVHSGSIMTSSTIPIDPQQQHHQHQQRAYSGADHGMALYSSSMGSGQGMLSQSHPAVTSATAARLTATATSSNNSGSNNNASGTAADSGCLQTSVGADHHHHYQHQNHQQQQQQQQQQRLSPTITNSADQPTNSSGTGLSGSMHAQIPQHQQRQLQTFGRPSTGTQMQSTVAEDTVASSAYLGQQQTAQCSGSSYLDFDSLNPRSSGLLSGYMGSAQTDVHGSDYFGSFSTAPDAPQRTSLDDIDLQNFSFSFGTNLQGFDGSAMAAAAAASAGVGSNASTTAAIAGATAVSTPGGDDHQLMHQMGTMVPPLSTIPGSDHAPFGLGGTHGYFNPLSVPPPMPPLLQPQTMPHAIPAFQAVSSRRPHATEHDALSFTLGNVGIAMAKKDTDADFVQSTLDHLSYVTQNISSASQDALVHAKEAAAEAVATSAYRGPDEISAVHTPIHESLLRMERRVELAEKAVHNYFCFLHHQVPIIHKPTFISQLRDGTVNHFVWFALRALTSRIFLNTHMLQNDEVLIEEEYFAAKAHAALSSELNKPSVEVVQGLALLSLFVYGTPRWQEASMYWCKATRLAQLMDFHVIDAPTRSIATRMHFGIFEPPKQGSTHSHDLALTPGDFAGQYVPLSLALTPLEAELRRRLWWVLFTNERFCSIAERLPTMVDEARMFVHFPCNAREWDRPVFTYQAPDCVPRYLREGYTRPRPGDDMHKLTLGQEMRLRKNDNLYMMSEIEYGFTMSHLVAFLADMSSLFRPRSPYGNDYTPMYIQMSWTDKMKTLRTSVERVECICEMVRQDYLQRLATPVNPSNKPWTPVSQPASAANSSVADASSRRNSRPNGFNDPLLDCEVYAPGIELPHLHYLAMLILYSALNMHLYRMVFQIHYEYSSSLPAPGQREQEDMDLLAAFDQYVKDLWLRTTTAAQQVSRILRGEYPGIPLSVLALAGIRKSDNGSPTAPNGKCGDGADSLSSDAMDVDMEPPVEPTKPSLVKDRMKQVFKEKIKAQEAHLRQVAMSVFASYRRTLPYSLLLAAKIHIDNIDWWAKENQETKMAHAYLDLAEIVRFLETHQTAFSNTDYVSLVKGVMSADAIN